MIVQADMIAAFGESELKAKTDRVSGAVINEEVLTQAMVSATGEVETYLFAAGLATISATRHITQITCDIARYRLYEDGATEEVKERYKAAIAWLDKALANPAMLTGVGEFELNEQSVSHIQQRAMVRA